MTINYGQFDKAVEQKEAENPYLTSSIPDGASIFFIFKGMEQIRARNNFSGKIEDQWHYEFTDMAGNKKEWDAGSLAIFNQFKDQNIQPDDKVLITKKVDGNKKRYVIKKQEKEEIEKEDMSNVKQKDIPVVDKVDEKA